MVVMGERTDCAKWVLSLFLVTKRLYAKEPEWSRGQIKTCRKKQHVKIDGMIGVANLICGKSAVGGNYNSTHDNQVRSAQGIKRYWLIMSLTHFMCCTCAGESYCNFTEGYKYFCDYVHKEQLRYIYKCVQKGISFEQLCTLVA